MDYVSDAMFVWAFILVIVRLSGVNVSITFKGTLNVVFFMLYVKCVLASTFGVGDVVFWIVCRCIRWLGCLILFLSVVFTCGFCLCICRI